MEAFSYIFDSLKPLVAIACGLLFPVFFWCATVWAISLSGWRSLAARYRTHERAPAGTRHFCYMGINRWVGYKGALSVGMTSQGLYLAVWPIFRFGHPPLLIPWAEISAPSETWLMRRFSVGRPPVATLSFYKDLAGEIERERVRFSL